MVNEQYLFVVNDKDRDREISFFVDVGHAVDCSVSSAESRNFSSCRRHLELFAARRYGPVGAPRQNSPSRTIRLNPRTRTF